MTNPSVEPLIRDVRGDKVMLDADLAGLYGVPTRVLNQVVKRNDDRFPEAPCPHDFAHEYSKQIGWCYVLRTEAEARLPFLLRRT
ncbi:MAG: ORF6N domain-containing protein [Burkholderiales bacterium]